MAQTGKEEELISANRRLTRDLVVAKAAMESAVAQSATAEELQATNERLTRAHDGCRQQWRAALEPPAQHACC